MNITGNTILITGGTSGIGRALAEALHTKGNRVIIAGRRQTLLDEVTSRNPGMVGLPVDMSDSAAVQRFADEVKERFPQLNVLINNAGISGMENYKGDTVDATQAAQIIQVNVTSGLAFVPFPPGPVYSATKAFLHNWLDAVRVQLRGTSVEVLELAPPYVQTELGGAQQASDPRAMPLDAFTQEVVGILESGHYEKGEILVDNVKPLRWAEKNGQYEQVLDMLANFLG